MRDRLTTCVALTLMTTASFAGMLIDRATAPWHALKDAKLREAAAVALTNAAQTVTAKTMVPPSGDKHDYMSFGPYWWPDPTKADGLPYIRRDGEENPQSKSGSDRVRLEQMIADVEVLAAAAKRFQDRAAGAEAVRKLRVFFLDPATRMNPHLNYGQAIPGRCEGRGIGLIDTRFFANRLLDALAILEKTGDLTAEDLKGLKAWYAAYLDWMLTSPIGLDEQDEHNNHGTAYDLQAASFAWFVGKEDLARKILENDTKKRIAAQIQPNGSMPHEMSRTRSLTYSTMNVTLFCELALIGEKVNVDLWNYETPDGRSIRRSVEWLMPYWRGDAKWTRQQITPVPKDIGREALAIYQHFCHAPKLRPALTEKDALHVVGNRLVNADGQEVWLQGVAICGLEWRADGDNIRESFEKAILDWNVNCIRLATGTKFWFAEEKGGDSTAYRQLIDDLIAYANARGVYVAIDLHEYKAPTARHARFWTEVAAKYANRPGVLFDLLNEPHDISWREWRDGGELTEGGGEAVAENDEAKDLKTSIGMQKLVETVRATGAKNPLICGCLDWSYDCSGVLKGYALEDKTGNGIVYSVHVYPWKSDWQGKFLDVAAKHPVFLGEVGCQPEAMPFEQTTQDPYVWGPKILACIQKHRLNWTAWSFHPWASPCVLADWDYTPTPYWGAFVRAALRGVPFKE